MKASIYRLKLCIINSKPRIWRRIEIPENYTFFEFHIAIQDAFQWTGHQYHIFEMGKGQSIKCGVLIGIPDAYGILEILPEKVELILNKFTLTNKNCIYSRRSIYNNYVNCMITLDKILDARPNINYPRCTAGRRQAPEVFELSGRQKFSLNQIIFRDPKNTSNSDDSDED